MYVGGGVEGEQRRSQKRESGESITGCPVLALPIMRSCGTSRLSPALNETHQTCAAALSLLRGAFEMGDDRQHCSCRSALLRHTSFAP